MLKLAIAIFIFYIVGLFCFGQVIGSIQHASERGKVKTFYTILLWGGIAIAVAYFAIAVLDMFKAVGIAYAVALSMTIKNGRIPLVNEKKSEAEEN